MCHWGRGNQKLKQLNSISKDCHGRVSHWHGRDRIFRHSFLICCACHNHAMPCHGRDRSSDPWSLIFLLLNHSVTAKKPIMHDFNSLASNFTYPSLRKSSFAVLMMTWSNIYQNWQENAYFHLFACLDLQNKKQSKCSEIVPITWQKS
jgi:hypothetical protein